MVLIGVVTLTATRSLWWALVPLLAGWVVWLATEWVLSTFHMKLSLSGGPLVAQIIVLTMPAASHLAIHFRDERRREGDARVAARKTLQCVWLPDPLVRDHRGDRVRGPGHEQRGPDPAVRLDHGPLHPAGGPPGDGDLARRDGPAVPARPAGQAGHRLPVGRGVERVTEWVYHHPARVVVGLVAIVIPVASGMGRLTYESNYINAFKPETRVVRDYRAVESRLGGIGVVELVVPASGPVDLGHARSVPGGREWAGRGLRDGPAGVLRPLRWRRCSIPIGGSRRSREASADRILAAKLDLIAASPQAELLRGFLNSRAGKARILVRLVEQQPAADKSAIFDRATGLAIEAFGPGSYLTGLSFLMTKTTQGVITTQWTTFTWSVLGILLMLTIALRGPLLAALAILPTLLAVALVLGLMGWLGIKLDMATALVASVALGLSVDDTFHCLLQFRRYRASEPFQPSLFASYAVTGPGVLLSSTAVAAGFLALRLSEFTPFSNFGAMVAVATAGSTIGNILLLPACLTLGERWSRAPWKKPVIAEV